MRKVLLCCSRLDIGRSNGRQAAIVKRVPIDAFQCTMVTTDPKDAVARPGPDANEVGGIWDVVAGKDTLNK
jgi:hypothetical protein